MKMLYAHSGNECANASCHTKLVYIEDNAKDDQICHIEAASPDGPRYNPNQTDDERSGYDNLILLCHKCHDMIDNNPETYTVELLKKWKKEHEAKYKTDNKEKVFRTPIPDGLLPRDNEVDKLFDGISNNRIYNLIGVGGSGKTSLTYLLANKYKNQFDNIAYVVVNGNIKEDFVSQISEMLDINFEPSVPTDTKYNKIISDMDKYENGNNLLILDVNETADKTAIEDYAKKLKNNTLPKNKIYPNGWKILILSREKFGDFHHKNLSDDVDKEFLKELFLKKAGKNEDDFDDYAGLFELIKYSPLLAEQLGIYFEYQSIPSLEEIKDILYGDLREEEIQGTNAHNREERTLICFLKNLIDYKDFNDDEQVVLRHFVLWKSEYISINIIIDLLKGTCHNLNKALGSLAKRSILNYDKKDKIDLYKLHGLLADSLREQIIFEKEYWTAYVENVRRIIEYDYYKFLPYVDCIGNSLCEYDITTNYTLLYNAAFMLQVICKVNYACIIYNKVIKIVNCFLPFNKDNSELQNDLASAYNNIAIIQKDYLRDYESAKSNCENAIAIRERLPKDNPKYQNGLANSYNNLASLLQDNLGDYELAKSTIEKTIVIYERLPKDNPEYLRGLAKAYNNLTLSLQYIGDYKSAKSNCENAIAIGEQLPKDNSEYQNDLVWMYINLANIQNEHLGDYESAKSNYLNVISLCKRFPKEILGFQHALANAYIFLANLQTDHLGDYQSAVSNYEIAISISEHLPKDNYKFQFILAWAYYNLAYLQHEQLGDFELAETTYEKAISIGEQFTKDNPKFQEFLTRAYDGLAILQMNLKKFAEAEANFCSAINFYKKLEKTLPNYLIHRLNSEEGLAEIYLSNDKAEKAKEILDRIQPLAKKCLADNPDDDIVILINNGINETVEKCSQILNKDI